MVLGKCKRKWQDRTAVAEIAKSKEDIILDKQKARVHCIGIIQQIFKDTYIVPDNALLLSRLCTSSLLRPLPQVSTTLVNIWNKAGF